MMKKYNKILLKFFTTQIFLMLISTAFDTHVSFAGENDVKKYQMMISGQWTDAKNSATREIRDPANNELIAIVPESSREDVAKAIHAAREAFDHGPWRKTTTQDRKEILFKIAEAIRTRAKMLAELEVRNNGKPLREAEADITDTANLFEYYGNLAVKLTEEPVQVPINNVKCSVVREPIGVCGQIIPWNYPLLMAAWKLAPALAAGNTCVLKPSEMTPVTALELAQIIMDLNLPPGVVNIVTGPGAGAGEELTSHPQVDKLAFTGGTVTGRKVAHAAAETLKKCSLELGGKSANIVFADSNFEAAVDGALVGIFANQGEVCSSGSRLLVERTIYQAFIEAMLKKIPRIKLGQGLNPDVKMGPLISAAHRNRVEEYIRIGIQEGATLRCGGKRPEGQEFANGNFLEPTIFDNVKPSMRIAREEIFGPVLTVMPFETEEEAIELANDSEYGLAAGIWTKDKARANRVKGQLRVGIVWINTFNTTYNELPWGGYKQSGIGRELGTYGIEEYLEVKQVTDNLDEAPLNWY